MKIITLIILSVKFLFSQINYYKQGIDNISFEDLKFYTDYKLNLKGISKFKVLFFKINKLDENGVVSKTREFKLILENDKFDCLYYLKDGKGKYEIVVFGNNNNGLNYAGLCYFYVESTENLPDNLDLNINEKILEFLNNSLGKTIGRGECWDLAAEALDYYSADWKRPTEFGNLIAPEKVKILPGDIIQMFNLKFEYKNKIEYFGLPEHTAIVYKVLNNKKFIIAHQNVDGKRYVILSEIDFNNVKSGYFKFYRPIAGLICK
jgi:hypothetical protein